MRRFTPATALLAALLFSATAFAGDTYVGTIASSGSSTTNLTTATPFTLWARWRASIQCDADSYVATAIASAPPTVTSTNGLKITTGSILSVDLTDQANPGAPTFSIGILPVTGSSNCKVFVAPPGTVYSQVRYNPSSSSGSVNYWNGTGYGQVALIVDGGTAIGGDPNFTWTAGIERIDGGINVGAPTASCLFGASRLGDVCVSQSTGGVLNIEQSGAGAIDGGAPTGGRLIFSNSSTGTLANQSAWGLGPDTVTAAEHKALVLYDTNQNWERFIVDASGISHLNWGTWAQGTFPGVFNFLGADGTTPAVVIRDAQAVDALRVNNGSSNVLTVAAATGNLNSSGTVTGSNLSGTNTGDQSATIGTFGATPTANGATASGMTITLQPADSTHPGAMTAAQATVVANQSGTNTGDVTIGTYGSSPTANGASISGQVLTEQPADGTHPGGISLTTQIMGAGAKTFSGNLTMSGANPIFNLSDTTGVFSMTQATTATGTAFLFNNAASRAATRVLFDFQANSGSIFKCVDGANGCTIANQLTVAGNVVNSTTYTVTGNNSVAVFGNKNAGNGTGAGQVEFSSNTGSLNATDSIVRIRAGGTNTTEGVWLNNGELRVGPTLDPVPSVHAGQTTAAQSMEFGKGAATGGVLAVTFATAFSSATGLACVCVDTNAVPLVCGISTAASTTGVTFTAVTGGTENINWMCSGPK